MVGEGGVLRWVEDLEQGADGWREWVELAQPEEEGTLPGEWEKLTRFQKLLLLRAMRPDRVTTAMSMASRIFE